MKRAQFFEGTWGHGPKKIPTAKHLKAQSRLRFPINCLK